ncbi:MAG: hypothetical protein C4343_03155, partial [Chloroflexota bacterium]
TNDRLLTVVEGGLTADGRPAPGARIVAQVPVAALTSAAIVYDRVATPPVRRRAAPAPGAPNAPADRLPERGMDPGAVLLALLGSPNLASRRWVYEQYDQHVMTNTVEGPGRGAAVLRIKGTRRGLVASTDANQAVGAIDPYLGAVFSVAEAARNVSITGARPIGLTNCLNYGDPTRPEAFWELKEAVRGLADAAAALGLPITGGNVSLYNESPAGAIAPAPCAGTWASATAPHWPSSWTATGSCSSARRRRGSPDRPTRLSPGLPPRIARRPSTSSGRSRSRPSFGTPSLAASSPQPRMSLPAASPSPWPR